MNICNVSSCVLQKPHMCLHHNRHIRLLGHFHVTQKLMRSALERRTFHRTCMSCPSMHRASCHVQGVHRREFVATLAKRRKKRQMALTRHPSGRQRPRSVPNEPRNDDVGDVEVDLHQLLEEHAAGAKWKVLTTVGSQLRAPEPYN